MHRFPPLAPQDPPDLPRRARGLTRALPQISLPWLELGLGMGLLVLLQLA